MGGDVSICRNLRIGSGCGPSPIQTHRTLTATKQSLGLAIVGGTKRSAA